ncbi:histidine phosphatase family protein [Micromonospora globispora]|uniref:histidine phosphatase family protein n=1 Tax=Micromonospora globispora TaxID=1450148 RepID=UPI000F5FB185
MRHGTCLDGLCRPHAHARPGTPLTTRGITEVVNTARRLLHLSTKPDVILTSPLPRATMSARILSEILGAPIAPPDPLYAEWRSPDCVLGLSPDDYPSEYQAWRSERLRDPDSALPGGESLTALRQRAMEAVSRAHEAAQQGAVLIVSHRVFIDRPWPPPWMATEARKKPSRARVGHELVSKPRVGLRGRVVGRVPRPR